MIAAALLLMLAADSSSEQDVGRALAARSQSEASVHAESQSSASSGQDPWPLVVVAIGASAGVVAGTFAKDRGIALLSSPTHDTRIAVSLAALGTSAAVGAGAAALVVAPDRAHVAASLASAAALIGYNAPYFALLAFGAAYDYVRGVLFRSDLAISLVAIPLSPQEIGRKAALPAAIFLGAWGAAVGVGLPQE